MRTGLARRVPPWFRAVPAAAVMATMVAATGCVDRRFIIESNVPNAEVYIDNQSVGPAPAYVPFDYYGTYTMTIVRPNYETVIERVNVTAPWYSYPPLDFVAEILWPFHIHDTRTFIFELHESTRPRVDDLINSAEALRQRANNLPTPEHPAPPKLPAGPPPVLPGPLAPSPGPVVPSPGPVVPSPGPQPASPAGPAPGVGPPQTVPADPLLPPAGGNQAPVVPR